MENTQNTRNHLFAFIRHSERSDECPEEGINIEVESDPPITTKGI